MKNKCPIKPNPLWDGIDELSEFIVLLKDGKWHECDWRRILKTPLKRLNKNSEAARKLRIEAAHSEAQKAVSENRCPTCGHGVRRNNSILGWVQCEQFGAEQFRKYPSQPACNWQGFTQ